MTDQPAPSAQTDPSVQAGAASAAGSDTLVLTAPPAVAPVAPVQAQAAMAVDPKDVGRLDGLVDRYLDGVTSLDVHGADFRKKVDDIRTMGDEDVISELVGIRGIGRWTAEMFLIFNLLRPDVLPLDDLGLLKGISVNYFSGEPVSRAEAREVGEAWAPFRSVATWYIWRSLDPLPVDY